MVPVGRYELRDSLSADPVVRAFAAFLSDAPAAPADAARLDERQRLTIAAISALRAQDAAAFRHVYDEIQRRRISEESDWIFDDYLMFCLSCGVVRFGLDPTFLQKALAQRRTIQGDAEKAVVGAMQLFLDKPDGPTDSPLVLVARELADRVKFDEGTLRDSYREAVRWIAADARAEFRRLIGCCAMDVTFTRSTLSEAASAQFMREFARKVSSIAHATYWGLLGLTTVGWGVITWYYLFGEGTGAKLAEQFFSMSVVITPVAVLLAKNVIVTFVERQMLNWSGCPVPAKPEAL